MIAIDFKIDIISVLCQNFLVLLMWKAIRPFYLKSFISSNSMMHSMISIEYNIISHEVTFSVSSLLSKLLSAPYVEKSLAFITLYLLNLFSLSQSIFLSTFLQAS